MIITLFEAKRQSRIDHDLEDDSILDDISSATAAIKTYLGDGAYNNNDPADGYREDVKTACKILVATFYRYRTGDNPDRVDAQFGYGYLPNSVTSLLFPYRQLVMS